MMFCIAAVVGEELFKCCLPVAVISVVANINSDRTRKVSCKEKSLRKVTSLHLREGDVGSFVEVRARVYLPIPEKEDLA